ncbi:MAG: hypothetical protein L6R37_002904 [Teloschistes peruensis]|nr:MAG: hypothetical protein L6R37_002904 [Teloschistes peruensis]
MYRTRLRLMSSLERRMSPLEKYNLDVFGFAEDAREDMEYCKKKLNRKATSVSPKDLSQNSPSQPEANGTKREANAAPTNMKTGMGRSNPTDAAPTPGEIQGTMNGAAPGSSVRNTTNRNKRDHQQPSPSQHYSTAKPFEERDTLITNGVAATTPDHFPAQENNLKELTDERPLNPRVRNSANRTKSIHHNPLHAPPPPHPPHIILPTEQEESDTHMTASEAGREGISTRDHVPLSPRQTINGRALKPRVRNAVARMGEREVGRKGGSRDLFRKNGGPGTSRRKPSRGGGRRDEMNPLNEHPVGGSEGGPERREREWKPQRVVLENGSVRDDAEGRGERVERDDVGRERESTSTVSTTGSVITYNCGREFVEGGRRAN